MATKRKRIVLPIASKIEILNLLNKGESSTKLADIYGIGISTIRDIKNNRQSILKYVSALKDEVMCRKTMRKEGNTKVEDAVYDWFVQARKRGQRISGPLLCKKALEFNECLGGNCGFKASNGWLRNFKSRRGIRDHEFPEGEQPSNKVADLLVRDLILEQKNVTEVGSELTSAELDDLPHHVPPCQPVTLDIKKEVVEEQRNRAGEQQKNVPEVGSELTSAEMDDLPHLVPPCEPVTLDNDKEGVEEQCNRAAEEIEMSLLRLHQEKLLLELEKLSEECERIAKEKLNIVLQSDILKLRLQLMRSSWTTSTEYITPKHCCACACQEKVSLSVPVTENVDRVVTSPTEQINSHCSLELAEKAAIPLFIPLNCTFDDSSIVRTNFVSSQMDTPSPHINAPSRLIPKLIPVSMHKSSNSAASELINKNKDHINSSRLSNYKGNYSGVANSCVLPISAPVSKNKLCAPSVVSGGLAPNVTNFKHFQTRIRNIGGSGTRQSSLSGLTFKNCNTRQLSTVKLASQNQTFIDNFTPNQNKKAVVIAVKPSKIPEQASKVSILDTAILQKKTSVSSSSLGEYCTTRNESTMKVNSSNDCITPESFMNVEEERVASLTQLVNDWPGVEKKMDVCETELTDSYSRKHWLSQDDSW